MKTNTPKLRFKEFTDDWQEKKLGDILSIGNGRDYKHLKPGNVPVYGTGGLMLYVNGHLYDGKSICIGRKGTIDKPQFLDGKFWTVDTLFYTHKYKGALPEFLYSIFQKINWQKYNEASGVPSLSKTTIERIKVAVPKEKEQSKIASFLTVVDEKIQKLEEKKKGFDKYKKGVMQAIFSQKIRFKKSDGSNYSDWEEKKLGDVFNHVGGTSLEDRVIAEGTHKFISIGNYSTDGKYIDNKQRINLSPKTILKIPSKNDLLMVLNDKTSSGDLIGSTILIDADSTYVYNQRTERLICCSSILPKFAWLYLNSIQFRKKIFKISQGGTQIYVNYPAVEKLKFALPSIEEQEKIAEFLTALDNKVDLINKELEQAKLFKKSLLQQMFL